MTGRKPIPNELKRLKNNPGRRSLPKPEEEVKSVPALLAPAPPEVSEQKYGSHFWDMTMPVLIRMGVLNESDLTMFAHYCIACSIVRESSEAMAKGGLVYQTKVHTREVKKKIVKTSTVIRKSPYIEIINIYSRLAQSFAAEFGLTPSARSKITFRAPPAKDSKLREFLNNGKVQPAKPS